MSEKTELNVSALVEALEQFADDSNWCYDTCNISRDAAKAALATYRETAPSQVAAEVVQESAPCPGCQARFPANSWEAGFRTGSGMCVTCDAALPAKDLPDRETELLDWLEAQAKSSPSGISFDYARYVEDGQVLEHGFRFMRRFFLGERKKTLRDAIESALLATSPEKAK